MNLLTQAPVRAPRTASPLRTSTMSSHRNPAYSQRDQSSVPQPQARPIPALPPPSNYGRKHPQSASAGSSTTPRYVVPQKLSPYLQGSIHAPEQSQQFLPIREATMNYTQNQTIQQAAVSAPHLGKSQEQLATEARRAAGKAAGRAAAEKIKADNAIKNAPKPTPEYLQQANKPALANGTPKRLLVLLDLNGTLVVRNRSNKKAFVPRPYLETFLQSLFKNHKVLVWSSAQPSSVDAMVKGIMTEEQQKRLVAVWNRTSLHLTPAQYREKTQVHKRLTWIWGDERIQYHADTKWDQTNTILIDDSYLKASSEPFNHIEVPEFTSETIEQERNQPPILRELLNYLEEASYFEDVSGYIRTHKFKMPGAIQGAGAPSASLSTLNFEDNQAMNLSHG